MKLPILLTAIALACGGAYAQTQAQGTDEKPKATAPATGDTLTNKIKRGAHKVADATRRAGHRMSAAVHRRDDRDGTTHAARDRDDTRTMGAGEDSGRRSRMDSAYENWKKKHQ